MCCIAAVITIWYAAVARSLAALLLLDAEATPIWQHRTLGCVGAFQTHESAGRRWGHVRIPFLQQHNTHVSRPTACCVCRASSPWDPAPSRRMRMYVVCHPHLRSAVAIDSQAYADQTKRKPFVVLYSKPLPSRHDPLNSLQRQRPRSMSRLFRVSSDTCSDRGACMSKFPFFRVVILPMLGHSAHVHVN